MQRTICGLSRLCYHATRPCLFTFDVSINYESKGQAPTHHRIRLNATRPTSFAKSLSSCLALTDQQVRDDDDLLSRCHRYNITSVSQLDRESDFDTRQKGNKCLVDESPYRQDLQLWDVLLDYRIRHYGSKGATTIWRGLKYRGPRVSLESEDDITTTLWLKLLSCAAEYNDLGLTKRLCEPRGIAWDRPKLFAETIGALLRSGRNFQVGIMCDQLKSKHTNGIADILELYNDFQPEHHDDLKAFCSVYDKVRPSKMYEQGVRHLFGKRRPEEAFLLHKFLISRGDFPASFREIEPFMKYLAKRSEDPGPFLRSLAASGVVFTGQGRRAHEHESQEIVLERDKSILELNTRADRPRVNKVNDVFAAKAFATKALSFEFILNALQAFGLSEIGPQSIREIGLNALDIELFSQRLAKLDELGIDTGGSAYSRFIRKICQARESTLLLQALRTDMHHEVFEDVHLQIRLLVESLNKCSWNQVHLLLAMLNHAQSIQLKDFVTVSLLESVVDDDLKARTFLTLLSNLVDSNTPIPTALFHDLVDHVILRLQNSKRKEKLSYSRYRRRAQFTAGVAQSCTAAGAKMTVSQWKMLIGQLGRSGAFRDVHKMALWLSVWYEERVENTTFDGQPAGNTLYILTRIFDSKLQGAIVYWALREQFHQKSGSIRRPWQTTLMLLRYLQTDCAVPLRLWTIRKTIVLFVRGLYHRSMPVAKGRGIDSRNADSRKLCFKLFRSLNQFRPRSPADAERERNIAVGYLLEQKALRANEVNVAARPTLNKAMRRFSGPESLTFNSARRTSSAPLKGSLETAI